MDGRWDVTDETRRLAFQAVVDILMDVDTSAEHRLAAAGLLVEMDAADARSRAAAVRVVEATVLAARLDRVELMLGANRS